MYMYRGWCVNNNNFSGCNLEISGIVVGSRYSGPWFNKKIQAFIHHPKGIGEGRFHQRELREMQRLMTELAEVTAGSQAPYAFSESWFLHTSCRWRGAPRRRC